MASRTPTRWARILHAKAAAEYAGYRADRDFLADVAVGSMPRPFLHAGTDAWDIVDLDAAVDAIKAGGAVIGNLAERAEAYAQARRVAGRRG